jgi:hypothetical protein
MNTARKLGTVGAIVAAAGLAAAATASASHASTHADASIERTITIHGQPMKWMQSQFIPRVQCPDAAPYLLNQRYNTDTGFRIAPGLQFSDYKSGFDASVDSLTFIPVPGDDTKKVFTGTSGNPDPFMNSVMNWSVEENSFTLTVHCTSDLTQAMVYPR